MTSTIRTQRRYDHRLRELVRNSKSVDVAVRHGVPRFTAGGWLAPLATPVMTLKVANQDTTRLQQEVIALRRWTPFTAHSNRHKPANASHLTPLAKSFMTFENIDTTCHVDVGKDKAFTLVGCGTR